MYRIMDETFKSWEGRGGLSQCSMSLSFKLYDTWYEYIHMHHLRCRYGYKIWIYSLLFL